LVASPQGVSPAGPQGPTGPAGIGTLNAISPTTTKGDIIVDNGANNPAASDVRLGVGADGKAVVADSSQPTGLNYTTITPNSVATSGDIAIFSGTAGTPVAVKDSKLLINANGAIQSTPSGGNARGVDAIDLQVDRAANTQVASGNSSVLTGGVNNTASGVQSTVSGGISNIASATQSTVGGGLVNTASGMTAVVAGGLGNTASQTSSSVLGGNGNTASGQGASVAGGETNTASATDSTVLGGTQNTASEVNSVALGAYAKADKYNQLAFGSDAETTSGGFQHSILLPVASTTDATPTAMLLNIGAAKRMTVGNNKVWGITGSVVAKLIGTPGACSFWSIVAAVKNNAGTVSLVGSATVTLVGQDAGFPGASAVAVGVDVGNVALAVTVTGTLFHNIIWGADLSVVELFSN
jgi:hypothetical protein